MTTNIFCHKLNKLAPALSQPPFANELGKKIQETICHDAWNLWLKHQTMLINEYRLSLIDPKARQFLLEEMQKFLFGTGSQLPQGYTPETSKE